MDIADSLRKGHTIVIGCSWLERETRRWVKRTWEERLFSRPWQPWRSAKLVLVSVPDVKAVYLVSPGVLVCHNNAAIKLRKWLDNHERGMGEDGE